MAEKQLMVSDKIIDEIVDDVLDSINDARPKGMQQSNRKSEESVVLQKGIFAEIENIKRRLNDFDKGMQRISNDVSTTAVEASTDLNEKIEDIAEGNEKQILGLEEQVMHLEGEIDFLRTSLVRISSELKKKKILE